MKLNLIDNKFVDKFIEFMDQIEASEGPACLVTINSGKVFSGGFSLMEMASKKNERVLLPMRALKDLYGRLLRLNVPTLCVLNGHAVAGGLFLALCHDKIIMADNPKLKCQFNESLVGMSMYTPYACMMKELIPMSVNKILLLGDPLNPRKAFELDLVQGLFKSQEDMMS